MSRVTAPHGEDPGSVNAPAPPETGGHGAPPGGWRKRLGVAGSSAGRTNMLRGGAFLTSAVVLTGLLAPSATAATKHAETLDWQPCSTAAKNWPIPDDTQTECAELRVPLDYTKPQGRMITIAVSRIKATGSGAKGAPLFYGAGGPGTANMASPSGVLPSGLGPLASDHDIISMDERGTGHSDKIACEEKPGPDLPATATEQEQDKAAFDTEAEFNKRCAASDPDFVRQLTPANVARDIDSLRQALGAAKMNFYGASFDTAIGLSYRSLFDDRVDHMWLDSVMPPVFDHSVMDGDIEAVGERSFGDFAEWLAGHDAEYHLGKDRAAIEAKLIGFRDELDREPRTVDGVRMDGAWVAQRLGGTPTSWVTSANDLVTALDGETPDPASAATGQNRRTFGLSDPSGGLNAIEYNAMLCNTDSSGTGFADMWAAMQARRSALPAVGGSYFSPWCADWPLHASPTPVVRGSSPLQLSGHVDEAVTPYKWAVETQKRAGGTMLTVQDDVHASLRNLPCAANAVAFFRSGKLTGRTCPGVD
jgi:pimeloyl-ACP methyl ester carboxylesterase